MQLFDVLTLFYVDGTLYLIIFYQFFFVSTQRYTTNLLWNPKNHNNAHAAH